MPTLIDDLRWYLTGTDNIEAFDEWEGRIRQYVEAYDALIALPKWSSDPPTVPGLYRWRITKPFVYAGFTYYPHKRGWTWVDVAHEYGDPQKPLSAFEPGNPRHFVVANLPGEWQGPIVIEEDSAT